MYPPILLPVRKAGEQMIDPYISVSRLVNLTMQRALLRASSQDEML